MIESITLYNFQKWKRLHVDFHPRTTTFVGLNGAGKSTLVRALQWVMLNQPSGNGVISWGTDRATVVLRVDGHKIARVKGKGVNYYKLNGKKFAAFGAGNVPDEIANILHVGIDNFQMQLDSPFWFTETPGQVGKELNQIINLNIIDETLDNVGKIARATNTRLAVAQERLHDAQTEERATRYVDDLSHQIRKLTKIHVEIDSNRSKSAKLTLCIKSVQSVKKRRQSVNFVVLSALKAMQTGRELAKLQNDVETLDSVIFEGLTLRRIAHTPIPDLSRLEQLHERITSTESDLDALTILIHRVKSIRSKLWHAKKNARAGLIRFRKMTRGRCPVCGSKTKT